MRCVRRTGELIAELPREDGGRGKTTIIGASAFAREVGIAEATAYRWQSLGRMPLAEFEAQLAAKRTAGEDWSLEMPRSASTNVARSDIRSCLVSPRVARSPFCAVS